MQIWVSQGPDFHAGEELRFWLRHRVDSTHSQAVIECIHELVDIRDGGFAGRRAFWIREGFDEVWTFQSLRFVLAATIVGDGRAENRDFCLVACDRIEGTRDAREMARRVFLDTVRTRLATGQQVTWEL